MNIKLDSSNYYFKQFEYFYKSNWKKLETLAIYTSVK